jgi:hypothetical protein
MGVAAERSPQASPARENLKGTTYELFILVSGQPSRSGPAWPLSSKSAERAGKPIRAAHVPVRAVRRAPARWSFAGCTKERKAVMAARNRLASRREAPRSCRTPRQCRLGPAASGSARAWSRRGARRPGRLTEQRSGERHERSQCRECASKRRSAPSLKRATLGGARSPFHDGCRPGTGSAVRSAPG